MKQFFWWVVLFFDFFLMFICRITELKYNRKFSLEQKQKNIKILNYFENNRFFLNVQFFRKYKINFTWSVLCCFFTIFIKNAQSHALKGKISTYAQLIPYKSSIILIKRGIRPYSAIPVKLKIPPLECALLFAHTTFENTFTHNKPTR